MRSARGAIDRAKAWIDLIQRQANEMLGGMNNKVVDNSRCRLLFGPSFM
jgi:hypothetical protein